MRNNDQLRKGYKLTEVGVIPEDWEVYSVRMLVEHQILEKPLDGNHGNFHPKNSDYVYYGIPFIMANNVVNGQVDLLSCKFISQDQGDKLQKGFSISGDVLLTHKGTVGNTALVSNISTDYIMLTPQVTYYRVRDSKRLYNYFLRHYFDSYSFQSIFINLAGGGTRAYLGIVKQLALPIVIPPLSEQIAIATVLSDSDRLIESLDRLIVKKRNLKQATMQQLLTGKIRLAGFSGEWEVKRLGEHLEFLRNGVNSRAELTIGDPVKYLHYGDIHGSNSIFLSPSDLPSLPSSKANSLSKLKNGDLVFADASEDLAGVGKSVEIVGTSGIEFVSGLHTIAIRFDKSILADGFKAYLQFHPTFCQHLRRLASGTKVYATNRGHITSIEINLPSIKEQTAIATILSDMDSEIAALEQQRDKTRALKQGMMQELLTGRIRLV
ncbi:restriction endonuclease subunit S [Pseudanabaena cinerea]|nr:restriction endonuclease subunit S [Pseudanabaena cinerea]